MKNSSPLSGIGISPFVEPTAHREVNEDAYDLRGSCGFSFGNGCSGGVSETNLFGTPKRAKTPMEVV